MDEENSSFTIFESFLHCLPVQWLLGAQQESFLQRSSSRYKITQRQLHLWINVMGDTQITKCTSTTTENGLVV